MNGMEQERLVKHSCLIQHSLTIWQTIVTVPRKFESMQKSDPIKYSVSASITITLTGSAK